MTTLIRSARLFSDYSGKTSSDCSCVRHADGFLVAMGIGHVHCAAQRVGRASKRYNSSAAGAEMGDRGHNRHGRREGAAVPLSRTAGTTSNTMWHVPSSTSVPSGVFIHPAVWPK